MRFSYALSLLTLSLSSALAAPQDGGYDLSPRNTCSATHITTIAITSVPVTITTYSIKTITTVATIPHSCFTLLIPTPQSDNSFCGTFNPKTCGPTPDCIILSKTVLPCPDPCCPTTQTIKTPGACASCQRGCATETQYITPTCGAGPTSTA